MCVLNSSLGANEKSRSFYLQTKGEVESAVARMGFERVVLARPSLIDAEREESRPAEKLGLMASRLLAPVIPKRYRPVRADTIAAALLREVTGEPGVSYLDNSAMTLMSKDHP